MATPRAAVVTVGCALLACDGHRSGAGVVGPVHAPGPTTRQRPAPEPVLRLGPTGLIGVVLRPPVTADSLAGQVPGYHASASTEWFESGPDDPVPVICLVRRGGACDLVLFTDAGGEVTRIRVLDPAVAGPGRLVVGAPHAAVAEALTPCEVVDGPERGLRCGVRGVENLEVWMALGDDVRLDPASTTPPAAALAVARVTYLWWWRPGT